MIRSLLALLISTATPGSQVHLSPEKAVGPNGGSITSKKVGNEFRTYEYWVGTVMLTCEDQAGGCTDDATVGVDGIVGKAAVFDSVVVEAPTLTVGAIPFPMKLNVELVDTGAGSGALTCTSVTIKGQDQFGNVVSEVITSVNETAQHTANVYESVTSAVGAGCAIASGGDSSDLLLVYASADIGLPFDIKSAGAVISICIIDGYAAGEQQCYYGSASDAATTFDNAGSGNRVDIDHDSVNIGGDRVPDSVSDNLTGNTLADGQEIRIRVRTPAGIK